MTRQHFILVADALGKGLTDAANISKLTLANDEDGRAGHSDDWCHGYDEGWSDGLRQVMHIIINTMSDYLAKTNEHFDRVRFAEWVMKHESLRQLNESADRWNREKEIRDRLHGATDDGRREDDGNG